MPDKVTIKGGAELKAKFRQLAADMQARILENAATAGALTIQEAAIENAPYDTGDLRRSIHIEVVNKTNTEIHVRIGTNLIYAAIQEFGGTIEAKKGPFLVFEIDGHLIRTKRVQIPAQPYLRPAFAQKRDEAVDEIAAAIKAQLP